MPFLKVANDTAIAVNQGGKRKGAVCAYLETWHIDIEEFLDLRKNTGDDRRRTHDMNTANWVPDLFMARVEADEDWTLFSPDETPELHDLYGAAFKTRYEFDEAKAARGEIRIFRTRARTGFVAAHPHHAVRDRSPVGDIQGPCNIRSPQGHAGVVHSSNLCTEITLNTSKDEVAVCNLGSINLANHVTPHGLDLEQLSRTVSTAMRMLDNVIDINFYTIPEARHSNLRHRPVGLGLMGFQDALAGIAHSLCLRQGGGLCRSQHGGNFLSCNFRVRRSCWRSVAAIQALTARSGQGASCPSTRSNCWTTPARQAAAGSTWIVPRHSIGKLCASA